MRTRAPGILVAAFLSGLLVIMGALPAMGYIKQGTVRVFLSGPSVVRCNQSAKITARVIDARTKRAVRGARVKWSLPARQSGKDSLNPRVSTTNPSGVASTRLFFGPKAGQRVIKANSGNATPVIRIRCAGGLPVTSIVPPLGFEEQPPAVLLRDYVEPPPELTGPALPLGTIRMPRLGIDLPVLEGDGYRAPDDAVAHFPDTAWPGDGSNTFIYGHAREGHFLELWDVRTGDLVEMDMVDGTSVDYRVSEIHPVVEWDALEYVAPTDTEILTLQTCLDYAETSPRFVVIAERIPPT